MGYVLRCLVSSLKWSHGDKCPTGSTLRVHSISQVGVKRVKTSQAPNETKEKKRRKVRWGAMLPIRSGTCVQWSEPSAWAVQALQLPNLHAIRSICPIQLFCIFSYQSILLASSSSESSRQNSLPVPCLGPYTRGKCHAIRTDKYTKVRSTQPRRFPFSRSGSPNKGIGTSSIQTFSSFPLAHSCYASFLRCAAT